MASTSSAYGANTKMPFQENDKADFPLTLRGEQEIERTHRPLLRPPVEPADHHVPLFHGLWTVGGARHGALQVRQCDPEGPPIDIYNHGDMERDFTFVADLVEGIVRLAVRCRSAASRSPTSIP